MKFKGKPKIIDPKCSTDKKKLTDKILAEADQASSFLLAEDLKTETWKEVAVNKEITVFSFRIPKKEMQQLKYLCKNTGMSINALCLRGIRSNNKEMIKEIEEGI